MMLCLHLSETPQNEYLLQEQFGSHGQPWNKLGKYNNKTTYNLHTTDTQSPPFATRYSGMI